MASIPKMSEPSKKVLIALGKIPSVDRIKELLGLNAAPVKVKNAFRDITVDWRKSNMTSDSRPATELLDWHSQAVQKDLRTLAESFLAENDYAERFWSGTRSWKYDSKLQYPNDKEKIIELLIQLFFKQNRYFKNNATYGQWGHKESESEASREESTPQRITSADTTPDKEVVASQQTHPKLDIAKNAFPTAPNFVDLSRSFGSSPPLQAESNPLPPRDIYDVPNEHESPFAMLRTSSLSSGLSSKHGRSEQGGEVASLNKRAKYSLRNRKIPAVKDSKSDNEPEDMLKESVPGDNPSTQTHRQTSPLTQKGPMLRDPDISGRQLSSASPAQKHPKNKSNGQPASEPPPQIPSPPLPSHSPSGSLLHLRMQPSAQLGSSYQPRSIRSPRSEVHTSILSPQPFAREETAGEGKMPNISNNYKAPVASSRAVTELEGKSQALAAEAPSKTRPKAQMNFFIITRQPRDTFVLWPEGKIQGTSLSSFIAGVAKATKIDNIEKLELTLKTATSDTKIPVYKEDEDSWLLAKRNFTERLREDKAKAKSMGLSDTTAPDIYIEPFSGQVGGMDEDEEEEISFF